MKIAILTIGDELLNGDLVDTNTAAIAGRLATESLPVNEACTTGDCEEDIAAATLRLLATHDAVIVTGGLGPTEDDRTAKAVARALARPLRLNEKALDQIRARFQTMQREMHPRNEKQAMLPGRSSVIPNNEGTAPGFHIKQDQAELFCLPGVPVEMKPMLEGYVLPHLLQRWKTPSLRYQKVIPVFGLAEPDVEGRIRDYGLPPQVELAFNVKFPMVLVKLRAFGESSRKLVDQAELAVIKALGDHVIGRDDDTLASQTAHLLKTTGTTISLAESCTGGLIAKLLTDHSGSSAFLERSVVSYADTAKESALNVSRGTLERHGAVSTECALAMVRGVNAAAKTAISLAVTGIAGPGGGTAEKPVGTVYIAMLSREGERVERFHFFGDRQQVRLRTASTALDWVRRLLLDRAASALEEE